MLKFLSLLLLCSCQKNEFQKNLPPMGSDTHEDELKKEIENIKESYKQSKDLDFMLAQTYFLKRRFIEASMILSNILKKEPNNHMARNLRARCLFFLGNPKKALKELQITLNTNPKPEDRLDALYLLGAFVYEMEDKNPKEEFLGKNAWKEFLKEKNLDPVMKEEVVKSLSFMEDEILLARNLIKEGKVKEALLVFERILKKDKNNEKAYHYQGMAHIMDNNPKMAIASWQECQKINPLYAKSFNLEDRIQKAKEMLIKD